MRGRVWSDEDLKIFIKEYPKSDINRLAKKLDRTPSSLYSKALKLGIQRQVNAVKPNREKLLNEEQREWFKKNFAHLSNKTISVMLHLPVPVIKKLALRYRLRKSERYRKECKEYSYQRKRRKIEEWQSKNKDKVKEYKQRYIKRKQNEKKV